MSKYLINVEWLNTETMEYEHTHVYAFGEADRDFNIALLTGDECAEHISWCRVYSDNRVSNPVVVKEDTTTEFIVRADKVHPHKNEFLKYAELVHGTRSLYECISRFIGLNVVDVVKWCVLFPNGSRSPYKIEKGAEHSDISSR